MGCYEREQQLIAEGKAKRGQAALDYFAELDAAVSEEATHLTHRPDYSKTLFAPENDDIYQEFCRFIDLPAPRHFDALDDQMEIEGFTAPEIYRTMMASNGRLVDVDGGAVYNMLVKLRTQPEMAKRVLDFKPTCYQNGCGKYDAAYARGEYGE
ncbi:MAG: hypothetical protein HFJ65_07690 [Eggerthellaceae bacterium]|nr:hypothetical protein [Eggerthellaceae bacterium]